MFLFAFAALGTQAVVGTVSVSYELNGKTVSFSGATLREVNDKMRTYWDVGDGCAYNAEKLPADGTGTLTWTVSGTVEQGDYLNEGALVLPSLSGGYIYRDGTYRWKKIEVKAAASGATINSNPTFDVWHSYFSMGTDTTTVTGVTLQGGLYVVPHGTVTFDGCTFTGQLRVPNGDGAFAVTGCTFTGTTAAQDSNGYVMHYQAAGKLAFTGNTVADGYRRGLNIDNEDLTATVERNKLGTTADAGRSAIQISTCVKLAVTGNEIKLNGGNAFTFHEALLGLSAAPEVSISGNTVTGTGYLVYDDAVASGKAFTSDNLKLTYAADNVVAATVDTTQGVKGTKTYGISTAVNNEVQHYVATVGTSGYPSLAAAFAALNATNHTLTLLKENAWDAATPVYWAAGTQKGYAATLTAALTAAYKANVGAITIVCRPGADVGTMTHGHVADDLTIYGNDAFISGGECDLEVDTYKFSRATGAQAADGAYLEKDITITAYELDNLGVWGQRNTDHTVTVNLTDCDGKAPAGNVQRVYISGTTGVNNITLTDCDFLTKATAVYSNADGAIKAVNCSFTGGQAPFNINHKANGTQTVAVENCTFTNCGDADGWKQFAAPLRLVNSGAGTLSAEVTGCAFAGTVGENGDILLGDGRTGQASNDVALKVTDTAANIQAQKPGYYGGETVDATKKATAESPAEGTLETSVAELLPVVVVVTDTVSAQAALDAATPNTTIIFKSGTYEPLFIRQTLEMSTRRSDLDKDGSYPAYLRSFKNLTLIAEEGAEVISKGITAEAGLFWHDSAPASNQVEMDRPTSGFISYLALENVTIDGIAFDSSERSAVTLRDNEAVATRGTIMVDGLTIQNCTGTGVASNKNIHFLAAGAGTNDQNFPGTEKKAFNNLVVKNCILDSYYQPIAFNNATAVLNGLTVTGNTFSNNGNSNVLQLSNKVNSGAFVIKNNLFKDLNGRVVRATNSTANWTITGNRLDKPIMYDDSGEFDLVKINVKAETVGTAVTESGNDWKPGALANGTYIADGDPALLPVAKIGDTYYWTLAAAAAAATDGKTITLISDVADAGNVSLKAGVTLDGDGHKVTGNSAVYINKAGGTVQNVVFEDIHNAANNLSAVYASGLEGTATITGCTFDNCDWDAIQATPVAGAVLTITGNVFDTDNTDGVQQQRYVHIQSAANVDFTATVTGNVMKGDTKQGALEAYFFADEEKIDVRHNYIEDMADVCILDGTGALRNDKVFPAYKDAGKTELYQPVAMIATSAYSADYYPTVAAALIGAKSGDTIQILAGTWGADAIGQLDEPGQYTNANIVRYKSLTIQPAEGAKVTFTSTLSLGYDDSSTANATMTVKDLTFDGASLKIANYVQTTVEGCTFVNGANSAANGTLTIIDSCCTSHKTADEYPVSQVTVTGCSIDGSAAGSPGIRIRNSGNVTITGNVIKNTAHNGILFESNGSVDNTPVKTVLITDNAITEWDFGNVADGGRAMRLDFGTLAADSAVTIENNVFRKAVTGLDTPDFMKITGAGAATVSLEGNDWNNELRSTVSGNSDYYTVDTATPVALAAVVTTKKEPVAQIGETKYETLQAAFDAAKTGDTVTLLSDITLTEQVNITKALDGLTLDGNGKTIICATTDDPLKSGGGSALYFGNANDHLYCTGIKIKDLTMTGTARFAIFLCGGTTTEFTNVKISGKYYIAVNLYGTHGATMTNCDISNSTEGTDKYISAIWSNVASANPLTLNNSKVDVIAINAYTTANELEPKIFVMDGSEVGEIHTFDDGSVSGNKKLCVSTSSTGTYVVKEYDASTQTWVDIRVAAIGAVGYATLADAIAAAKDGETVKLLTDVNGDGIAIAPNTFKTGLTVDFGDHTYTVGGLLVGSSGTASNGFQLNAGNKITFKNGVIVGATATAGAGTDWKGAPAILIQNYCDLTLEQMTVKGGDETCYTLSNNNGEIVIDGSTIVAGTGTKLGPFAFDVCRYSSYPSVHVTVKGASVIEGDVEISGTIGDNQSRQLDIEGGTFKGAFNVVDQPANIAISGGTFSDAVLPEYCAAGFIPTANGDGTYGVKKVAHVVAVTLGGEKKAMPFSVTWLAANIGADESSWTTAALEEKAANGLAKWQCYLFGLDPSKKDAKVVATAEQGTAEAIPLTVANADASASPLVTGGYVTVAYVLMGSNDGTAWTQVKTPDKRDGLAIPLTGTTYKFYRVDVTVTSAEGN